MSVDELLKESRLDRTGTSWNNNHNNNNNNKLTLRDLTFLQRCRMFVLLGREAASRGCLIPTFRNNGLTCHSPATCLLLEMKPLHLSRNVELSLVKYCSACRC